MQKNFAQDVHHSNTPNDWLLVLTKKDETFLKVGRMVSLYSKFFEEEAKKEKLKTLCMDTDFNKRLNEAVGYFT